MNDTIDFKEIIAENARRLRKLTDIYDPLSGRGATGNRISAEAPDGSICMIPQTMVCDGQFPLVRHDMTAWRRLRIRHDFEYWCATCVTIYDKRTRRDTRLILNRPQRRVTATLEQMRLADKPIRLIMLKARQWGGSTLIQTYMAWIQMVHRRAWNSLICAQVKDTSSTIRAMYAKLLADYPEDMWDDDGDVARPSLKPFQGCPNIRLIPGRDCRITLGSAAAPEAIRGGDYSMAHLSEVAFWGESARRSPENFIQAICGSILLEPMTLLAIESTANGVGNYFHSEWLRATAGPDAPNPSDKAAIFVPWYEIDLYSAEVDDAEALWNDLDDFELSLWERHGCTLQQIAWYHAKRREYPSRQRMAAEYPTDPVEAFMNTGENVFFQDQIESMRPDCRKATARPEPLAEITGDRRGQLEVWSPPAEDADRWTDRYVVSVDVGGRSPSADWSVITVIDRGTDSTARPEVAAQWRGHIDHDILADYAATIGHIYGDALLVIESNTLESSGAQGETGLSLLASLADRYPNLYHREVFDKDGASPQWRVGFHTNRATKSLVLTALIAAVRDGAYIERSVDALRELSVFEYKHGGAVGARRGFHDDIVMTRAIGLYIASRLEPPARRVDAITIDTTASW